MVKCEPNDSRDASEYNYASRPKQALGQRTDELKSIVALLTGYTVVQTSQRLSQL